MALTPGKAILALTHSDSGRSFGNFTYSVDAFDLPGLGAQYPESALWSLMPGGLQTGGESYLALGDSYSSGEGAIDLAGDPAFDKSTDTSVNKCHRSVHAYAYQIKSARGFADSNFMFKACSGALVADFVANVGKVGQWNEGPQLDAIAPAAHQNAEINLITVSVGGNDAGFAQILDNCVNNAILPVPLPPLHHRSEKRCLSFANSTSSSGFLLLSKGGYIVLRPSDGTWFFCTGSCLTWGPKLNPSSGYVAIKVPNLADLYKEIHRRAPNAKIRVLLYPHLFASNPPAICSVGTFVSNGGPHDFQLTRNEMITLNKLGDVLNTTISNQVAVARQTGVDIETVDPNMPNGPAPGFNGHAICDSQIQWINGVVLSDALSIKLSPFSFHPNATGQAEFGAIMQLHL